MLQSNIISNLNNTLRSNFASLLDGSGGGGPALAPELLAAREWWLDASEVSTITESSGRVSAWSDRSGNGRSVINADVYPLNHPVTGVSTLNGKNVIDVNANYATTLATAVELPIIPQPFHLFLVVNLPTNQDNARIVNGISIPNRCILWLNGTWTLFAGGVGASSIASNGTGPHFISALFDGAASKIWVNNNAPQTVNPGTQSIGGLRINGSTDNAGNHMTGSYAEFVLCSADNTAQVASMKDYLNEKWGLGL